MERYARVLQAAKQRGALPDDAQRRLHAAFVATDYSGQRWSVGLRTGAWNRFDQGQWRPAEPPDRLHLDEELIGELEALAPPEAGPVSATAESRTTSSAGRPLASESGSPPAQPSPSARERDEPPGSPVRPRDEAVPDASPLSVPLGARPPRARRATAHPAGHASAGGTALRQDWGPVALCLAIAIAFAAGGWSRGSPAAYVLAGFFALLAVVIVFMSQLPRRS